ncbi:MAG: leucyl aminopeptidase family protein [Deltaproteobacteria bacterium]|jgi:leucyl aminopeptidase|nr:leucyl aminopeptidase family protein [Deltaproteobacteria bacterium]
MNLKYKCEPVNGPQKPGTAVFLTSGPRALDERPELGSFRLLLRPHLASGAFKGGALETMSLWLGEGGWLLLVGLGDGKKITEGSLVDAAAKAAKVLGDLGLKEAVMLLPPSGLGPANSLELAALGALLALDRRPDYKSEKKRGDDKPPALRTLTLQHASTQDKTPGHRQVLELARLTAESQIMARNLTDRPANLATPDIIAKEAVRLAGEHGLKALVWDEVKLADEGAGGILAVGSASRHPPRMVVLEHQGAAPRGGGPALALVGKGVTFDSGGLCLKPPENMHLMKTDMAGAAVVLATMAAASKLKVRQPLVGVMPLAENLVGGAGQRPGDILTTLSGRTVEVMNTDAEGRLILCDALTLAQKYRPRALVDLATLTGACNVALGDKCAGLFSNDSELRKNIMDLSQSVGEQFWPLPLLDVYEDKIKSDLADFRESGGRLGGAVVASLFLRRFIDPEVKWAHMDIVGTARNGVKTPSCPEGATGFGVRTLLKLICRL